MKVMKFDDLCELPDGTIFSRMGHAGLYRRGEIDYGGFGPEIGLPVAFVKMTVLPPSGKTKSDRMGDVTVEPRGACHRYCVYDMNDLTDMVAMIVGPVRWPRRTK